MTLATVGQLDTSTQAFFRHRRVGGRNLITNLEGKWALLEDEDGLEGMPLMTGMPAEELQALLAWLTTEGRLGGGQ